MLESIISIIAGAIIGALITWAFEYRSNKESTLRHAETQAHNRELLLSNTKLQEQIIEMEETQTRLQSRMNEGFASSARPSMTQAQSIPSVLNTQTLIQELRSRLDASGQTSHGAIKSIFLSRGHSAQAFDDTVDELIRSGIIRHQGKVIEII